MKKRLILIAVVVFMAACFPPASGITEGFGAFLQPGDRAADLNDLDGSNVRKVAVFLRLETIMVCALYDVENSMLYADTHRNLFDDVMQASVQRILTEDEKEQIGELLRRCNQKEWNLCGPDPELIRNDYGIGIETEDGSICWVTPSGNIDSRFEFYTVLFDFMALAMPDQYPADQRPVLTPEIRAAAERMGKSNEPEEMDLQIQETATTPEPELSPKPVITPEPEEENKPAGGHVYHLVDVSGMTWPQAVLYCARLGGYPATLTTPEENEIAYQVVREEGYGSAYFGLSRYSTDSPWYWITGEPVEYTPWHEGEPNGCDDIENYGMFYYAFEDSTWNDGDFIEEYDKMMLCEWDSEENYAQYANIDMP